MSEAEKLQVGVIGIGGLARGVHLPALREIEGIELVALCDIIASRATDAAAKHAVPRTYTLYKEMLAKEKLDAVFVLVEPCNLFHITANCLRAGVHTFMEKPPGLTVVQTEALCRTAKDANRILQVGFNRRHIPVVSHVLKLMRKITTITQVEGRFMKDGSGAFDLGGTTSLAADVIHAIDLVRYMAGGEPAAVASVVSRFNEPVDNAWNAVIRFDNGATGVIQSNYQIGGRVHDFEVHGPGASAFINLGFGDLAVEAELLIARGKSGYSAAARGTGPHEIQRLDGMELAGSKEFYRYYGFHEEDRLFLECVRHGTQPLNSIADAVKTMRLVEMIANNGI
jgi:predicted dehydrogenase